MGDASHRQNQDHSDPSKDQLAQEVGKSNKPSNVGEHEPEISFDIGYWGGLLGMLALGLLLGKSRNV